MSYYQVADIAIIWILIRSKVLYGYTRHVTRNHAVCR